MSDPNPLGKKLLELIDLGPVELNSWGYYIGRKDGLFKRITLVECDWPMFTIGIHAGDDMGQARILYTRDALTDLQRMKLEDVGWTMQNKFHFSSAFGKNILTTVGAKGIGHSDYFRFWKKALRFGSLRQFKREDWQKMIENLVQAGVMNDKDLTEFENEIGSKKYGVINICPGIAFEKRDSFDRLKNDTIKPIAAEWKRELLYLIKCFE